MLELELLLKVHQKLPRHVCWLRVPQLLRAHLQPALWAMGVRLAREAQQAASWKDSQTTGSGDPPPGQQGLLEARRCQEMVAGWGSPFAVHPRASAWGLCASVNELSGASAKIREDRGPKKLRKLAKNSTHRGRAIF